jgi:5,5'-dehydrodivanillate O-demethylase oxygenase subunit
MVDSGGMLERDEPLDFTRTGPGTLAGRYLRLFWQPVYRAEDLAPGQAVPIQIMGERFTLYRGESGAPHLVAFRCAHRGTQLSTGWVEGDCIRCLYHGWKYDGGGQCVEQPGEDEGFAAKVRIPAYPAREYLGLIFAYLGEGEAPPFKRYPDYERPGILEVGPAEYWPCNYFNRLDNVCDTVHVLFAHREGLQRMSQAEPVEEATVTSEETDYGLRTTMVVPGRPPTSLHCHMPNVNQIRSPVRFVPYMPGKPLWVDLWFARVPVDDENSVTFVLNLIHLTGDEARVYLEYRAAHPEAVTGPPNAIADAILAGELSLREADRRLSVYQMFQIEDYVTQVGQGRVADRTAERLGRRDVGVILYRKIWRRELQALAEGRPLKAWRTPAGLADADADMDQVMVRRG